jgi:hypothetical protein
MIVSLAISPRDNTQFSITLNPRPWSKTQRSVGVHVRGCTCDVCQSFLRWKGTYSTFNDMWNILVFPGLLSKLVKSQCALYAPSTLHSPSVTLSCSYPYTVLTILRQNPTDALIYVNVTVFVHSHPAREVLKCTQLPTQWVPCLSWG